jgi:hypothetical protein
MSPPPSIKGLLLALDVEDVKALVRSGRLTRVELARRLAPRVLTLLDQPIQNGLWYDVEVDVQLLEILKEVSGKGDECLVARGAEAARKLHAAGLYQQFEYLSRMQLARESDPDARSRAFGRDMRILTTLSASSFNFGRWTTTEDAERPGCFRIDIADALAFPEPFCWTTLGYMNWISAQAGLPDLSRFTRPAPDRVVFRMTRRP